MEAVTDIIALWPSQSDFAHDVGVGVGLVRVWKHRRFIPAERWLAVEEAARRREIDGASASDLARLAARQNAGAA